MNMSPEPAENPLQVSSFGAAFSAEAGALPDRYTRTIAEMVCETAPLAVIDQDAMVLWSNSEGLGILDKFGFISDSTRRMVLPGADDQHRFSELLHSNERLGRMVIRIGNADDWIVIQFYACTVNDRPARVLRFAFSIPQTDCSSNGLAEQFSLTPTEIAVLDQFARMGSVKKIAAEMDIGVATVRSHLKHIYSKTGVHNGRELVRLIAAFDVI